MRFTSSLRGRVLIALVVLSLLPLVVVAYQGYHCGRMAVSDLMRLHVISVLEARQTMIGNWLDERVQDVLTLVNLPVVVERMEGVRNTADAETSAVLSGVLESAQAVGRRYESISLFDADWNSVVSSSHGGHDESEFLTLEFRKRVDETQGVYFGPAHLHEDNEVGSHFGSAIRNASGNTIGYLVANLNLTESLTPMLQTRSGLWNTGKAFIVDRNRQVITEPFPGDRRYAFQVEVDEELLNVVAAGNVLKVLDYKDFLSEQVIGAVAPLSIGEWLLVVEIEKREAMEWVDVLLFRVLLMVGVALIAVLFASAWISGLLGQPLAHLSSVAQRISSGHTEERLGPMKLDEAEDVRLAVNQMLDQLQEKEKELVRTATLATVGELTSSVVHEMRNPLSSVKMNLQSLVASLESEEENRELLEIAFTQVNRLEHMLDELLQYGRPLELSLDEVEIGQLLESVVHTLQQCEEADGIRIVIVDDLGPSPILLDEEHFQRVLINLVKNAIEASSVGGEVEIAITRLPAGRDWIRVTVSDKGSGVREAHLDKLFKPFFTTKSNGIGLGLANVKKIVSLHGGKVYAKSRSGGGTDFTVELPLRSK